MEAAWSRPLCKDHRHNRATGFTAVAIAAREPLEQWSRSVTLVGSGLQPSVVLVLTVHVPAIVLPCPFGDAPRPQ